MMLQHIYTRSYKTHIHTHTPPNTRKHIRVDWSISLNLYLGTFDGFITDGKKCSFSALHGCMHDLDLWCSSSLKNNNSLISSCSNHFLFIRLQYYIAALPTWIPGQLCTHIENIKCIRWGREELHHTQNNLYFYIQTT